MVGDEESVEVGVDHEMGWKKGSLGGRVLMQETN